MTFAVDTSTSPLTPVEIGAEVAIAWSSALIPGLYTSHVAVTGVLVKEGPNNIGASGTYAANMPGTAPNVTGPPQVAMLIRKNTLLGGRSGRGRMYLPGVAEDQVNEAGVITPAIVDSATARFEDFRGKLIAEGLVPLLIHGSASAPITMPIPISSFQADGRVATQRRRLR